MIKQLTNRGFKDQMRTVKFSGLDLITSRDVNGVGKSAVLEAFKLALTGEIPGRAKNVDDILQFTSLDEMKVEVIADTRQGPVAVERGFLRHAPCGEKRPVWINQAPRKYEEGSQWIRQHIGAVSISFDPFEFLNLSDSKKRQWIIAHSPESQQVSRSGLYLLLLARMVEKYLGSGIVHSLLISLGLASLDEVSAVQDESGLSPLKDRLIEIFHRQEPQRLDLTRITLDRAFRFWSLSQSAEQNSNAILAHLKAETLRLKNSIREQTAALSCMKPESKNGFGDKSKKIPDFREEINCLNGKIEDLERRIQQIRIQLTEKMKKDQRICFLQENISGLAEKLNGEMSEGLRNRSETWLKKLVDTQELQEDRNRINRNFTRWCGELREQEFCLHRLSGELKLKRDKQETLGSSYFACPVARQIHCDTDMNPYRDILEKEIGSLTLKEVESRECYETVQKKVAACKNQIEKLDAKLARQLGANREVQREIDLLQEEIQAVEKETAKARGMFTAYRDELNLLESDPIRIISGNDEMETLENEKDALKTQKDEIQKNFDEHLRQQGKMEALSELSRRKKQWEQELEIVKQVAELIDGIQGEMASLIAGALETEVNDTLKLIDGDYDFTLNLHGKRFEMGWNRDGKIIPFQTINSAHFVLFIVPFLAALMKRLARIREKSGLPTLKALCIEAESLTPGNLVALLRGLANMRERGVIDNVLVAHYHSIRDPEKLSGFQEHILEEVEPPVLA